MRIPLIAATVLSCACANTAHNLPPIQAAPTQTSPAPSKSANQKTGSLKSFKSQRALKSALSDVGRLREAYLQQELERRRQQCLDATKDLPIPFDCSNGLAYETVTVAGAVGGTSEDTNRQHEGFVSHKCSRHENRPGAERLH